MTISMYQASVPRFVAMLSALSAILDKAQTFADSRKVGATVLPGTRLFPDMLTMGRQVQIACDHAKGAAARLAGVDNPKFEDNEQTLAELKERIAKTIAFMQSVSASQIDGSEARDIALTVGGHDLQFKGMEYLLGFALPNFYFHLVTAYNLLRHNGVDIGKGDFMGQPKA